MLISSLIGWTTRGKPCEYPLAVGPLVLIGWRCCRAFVAASVTDRLVRTATSTSTIASLRSRRNKSARGERRIVWRSGTLARDETIILDIGGVRGVYNQRNKYQIADLALRVRRRRTYSHKRLRKTVARNDRLMIFFPGHDMRAIFVTGTRRHEVMHGIMQV